MSKPTAQQCADAVKSGGRVRYLTEDGSWFERTITEQERKVGKRYLARENKRREAKQRILREQVEADMKRRSDALRNHSAAKCMAAVHAAATKEK